MNFKFSSDNLQFSLKHTDRENQRASTEANDSDPMKKKEIDRDHYDSKPQ